MVKADGAADRDEAGSSSRAPRWGIAYKFPADTRTTTLLRIEVQVGRTGVITPVAVLEPVQISGVTVTSATLHNFDDLTRRNVRAGDTVFVRRAGDVIPEVTGAKLDERPASAEPFTPPAECPRCGGEIDRTQKRWRCTRGRACGAHESLAYYAARTSMDIEGLGDKIIDLLVRAGLVTDPADLYDLDVATLSPLDRMGDVSAGKLVANIQALHGPAAVPGADRPGPADDRPLNVPPPGPPLRHDGGPARRDGRRPADRSRASAPNAP